MRAHARDASSLSIPGPRCPIDCVPLRATRESLFFSFTASYGLATSGWPTAVIEVSAPASLRCQRHEWRHRHVAIRRETDEEGDQLNSETNVPRGAKDVDHDAEHSAPPPVQHLLNEMPHSASDHGRDVVRRPERCWRGGLPARLRAVARVIGRLRQARRTAVGRRAAWRKRRAHLLAVSGAPAFALGARLRPGRAHTRVIRRGADVRDVADGARLEAQLIRPARRVPAGEAATLGVSTRVGSRGRVVR